MTKLYSCSRRTSRWPFRVFMELIDISALNAYVIWMTTFPDWSWNDRSRSRIFLRELGVQLITPNVLHRQQVGNKYHLSQQYGFKIDNYNYVPNNSTENEKLSCTRGRCVFCPRNIDRKTQMKCTSCNKPVCSTHKFKKIVITRPDCQKELTDWIFIKNLLP
mgnify:CR=1 FL=1